MIHALLITNEAESADLIGRLARHSEQVTVDRLFCPAPKHPELALVLNTLALDVVLLDVTRHDEAVLLHDQIKQRNPQLPVVGFSLSEPRMAAFGPAAFSLSLPLSPRALMETVRKAIRASRPHAYNNVFAILPAKAGAGASTIAMNVAAQLASSYRQSIAVVDGDLRSGMLGDCLGIRPQQSIAETLGLADLANTLIWPRHVAPKAGVDFLLTNREPQAARPAWHTYHHLLAFISRRYDRVLVDLPEMVDDANAEVLESAARVYIATTPEFLSLTLARQRIVEMEAAHVDRSRIRILLNRWHARDLKPKDVTDLLGCPVEAVFPNDYSAVRAAIDQRTFVESKTRLSSAYRAFAGFLAGSDQPPLDLEKFSSFLGSLRMSIASGLRSSTAA
jgi:MinD-like ATPase involved in chromosome partitioning or flagellar assembly